jgi:CRP-like cAMP-binding protein
MRTCGNTKEANGRSMFLKFYQGFQMLGDLEFLKNIPVLCNIEAVKDSHTVVIPADFLRKGNRKISRDHLSASQQNLKGTGGERIRYQIEKLPGMGYN